MIHQIDEEKLKERMIHLNRVAKVVNEDDDEVGLGCLRRVKRGEGDKECGHGHEANAAHDNSFDRGHGLGVSH